MTDPLAAYPWAPSVDDIARVSSNYTLGGFDDDNDADEGQPGAFTESTSPTASEVEGLILTACEEVAGRAGVTPLPTRCYARAKTAAKWHVAMTIAGDKEPANTDDAAGEYRSKNLNYVNTLAELVSQARMAFGNRLH
jgi:hypothetical protein